MLGHEGFETDDVDCHEAHAEEEETWLPSARKRHGTREGDGRRVLGLLKDGQGVEGDHEVAISKIHAPIIYY